MIQLLYITLGESSSMHLQAAFSAGSFKSFADEGLEVSVLTDAPLWYQKTRLFTPTVLDKARQTDWKGKHQFFWRIKIKALAWAAAKHPGIPVFYLDTDTFAYKDPTPLFEILNKGNAIMHLNEGMLNSMRGKTVKQMWQQVQRMQLSGLQPTTAMWNAGVVASPNTKGGAEFELALSLCDQMLDAAVTPRLVEQLALSIALEQTYGLEPANQQIAHYWSNKGAWDLWIAQFFAEQLLQGAQANDLGKAFTKLDWSAAPAISTYNRNTARRLHSLLDNWFPAQEELLTSGNASAKNK